MERVDSATWRKSSFSGSNGGNCIEVGTTASAVLVRDTKDHGDGPLLAFAPRAWEAFAAKVKQS
jgi:hypothetical protein